LNPPDKTLDKTDHAALKSAVLAMENPSFAIQLASWVGRPVEKLMHKLPESAMSVVEKATNKSLRAALAVALKSLDPERQGAPPQRWRHRAAVTVSGGVGGLIGIASLPIELPISTIIMLRSIADIARAEGEDLGAIEPRLACIEVFALGGKTPLDDAAESSYFLIRAALAREISAVAARRGVVDEASPAMLRLIASVARRFAPQVAEKVAAEVIPLVAGAVGGASVNLIFLNHFQRMAQGHFTIRRLERKYGANVIRHEYDRLAQSTSARADQR
jgi:hypothetical protein